MRMTMSEFTGVINSVIEMKGGRSQAESYKEATHRLGKLRLVLKDLARMNLPNMDLPKGSSRDS